MVENAFQIATDSKGRGVLRILLIQQQMNLLCIPALCLQLIVVAYPSTNMPNLVCLLLEMLFMLVSTNRAISDLAVALGRYNQEVTHVMRVPIQCIFQDILPLSGYNANTHQRRNLLHLPRMDPSSIFCHYNIDVAW